MNNEKRNGMILCLPESDGNEPDTEGLVRLRADTESARAATKTDGDRALSADDGSITYKLRLFQARLDSECGEAVSAWRGLLAFALLGDLLCPEAPMNTVTINETDSLTAKAAYSLLPENERVKTLRVLVMKTRDGEVPIGFVSADMILSPADGAVIPSNSMPRPISWYDADRECFIDPCGTLNSAVTAVLTERLTVLAETENIDTSSRSRLGHFLSDLRKAEKRPAELLRSGDTGAVADLSLRLRIVCGLDGEKDFPQMKRITHAAAFSPGNALIDALCTNWDGKGELESYDTWTWNGVPIAAEHALIGFCAAGDPRESEALRNASDELARLDDQLPAWNARLASRLKILREKRGARLDTRAAEVLDRVIVKAESDAEKDHSVLHISCPWPENSGAARMIFREALGDACSEKAACPFADKLTVIPECPESAIGDAVLRMRCIVWYDQPVRAMALPPVSSSLARLLSGKKPEDGGIAFLTDSLTMRQMKTDDGREGILAVFAIQGAKRLEFDRFYDQDELLVLAASDLPYAAVWPYAVFPDGSWKDWWLLTDGGSQIHTEAVCLGRERTAVSGAYGRRLEAFPDWIVLYEKDTCVGAIPVTGAPVITQGSGHAAVAIDIGASSSAAALTVDGVMIGADDGCAAFTVLENGTGRLRPTIPNASAVRTALCLADVNSAGEEPFLDAWIANGSVSENRNIYASLKWGTDARRDAYLSLYLSEWMLITALRARLHGAGDIVWRAAYPDGMAVAGRKRWREVFTRTAAETERCTGLLSGDPKRDVSFTTECLAEASFFRNRQDASFRSGMLCIDIGAAGVDLTLWLRGMKDPSAAVSVPLGLRLLLIECAARTGKSFASEFFGSENENLKQSAAAFAAAVPEAVSGRCGMDAAEYAADLMMEQSGASFIHELNAAYLAGRCTLTGARLLLQLSWLMLLAGQMLEQAYQNASLNDLLPITLPVIMSGRGSLALSELEIPLRTRLGHFLRLPMSGTHPTRGLQLVFSDAPKMEAACGMLMDNEVRDVAPDDPRKYVLHTKLPMSDDQLLLQFLWMFRMDYPAAAERLFSGIYAENGTILPTAVETVTELCTADPGRNPASMQSRYAAIFTQLLSAFQQ